MENFLFTLLVYLPPISFIMSICLFIISFILKIKEKDYKKTLLIAIIFLSIVILWFIGLIIIGLIGVGPGRFN